MRVYVNGEPRELADDATVATAVAELVPQRERGLAAALEGEVVPRGAWERTALHDGARVEVVEAVQGG